MHQSGAHLPEHLAAGGETRREVFEESHEPRGGYSLNAVSFPKSCPPWLESWIGLWQEKRLLFRQVFKGSRQADVVLVLVIGLEAIHHGSGDADCNDKNSTRN